MVEALLLAPDLCTPSNARTAIEVAEAFNAEGAKGMTRDQTQKKLESASQAFSSAVTEFNSVSNLTIRFYRVRMCVDRYSSVVAQKSEMLDL